MSNRIIYIGMDVHSTNFTFCALEPFFGVEDKVFGTVQVKPNYKNVLNYIKKLQKKLGDDCDFICGYEAGCLGYSLYNQLTSHDVNCVILAPTTMMESKGKRVKTDRRDAKMIAECLAYGTYSAVYVPDPEDVSCKEYIRMRSDFKAAQKRVKQQIKSYCLREGIQYEGNSNWTSGHLAWLRKVDLPSLRREMLDEYLAELDHLTDKIERLDSRIEALASGERYRENVSKLVCLLGIKTHTAMSLLVETGDFKRFKKAELFASFLGLTPSENSSSDKVNRGGITKAGNSHLRRLLMESAQGYSKGRPGYKSKALKARQAGNKAAIIQYADKANDRLRRKFQRMTAAGKPHNVAKTAIARELACFVWGIMTDNVA